MFRNHIIESGVSRGEWATALGISESYLTLLMLGKKSPSLKLAFRIEHATDGAVPAESWVTTTGEAVAPPAAAPSDEAAA